MLQFPISDLREKIYATVIFFDIFEFPLTLEEIQRYLLGKYSSLEELNDFLKSDSAIEHKTVNNCVYFFLKGRKNIVQTRLERKIISKKFWRKVRIYMPFIQLIPFMKMVAVCNTLAFNNTAKGSDIDLFIIAKRNRLFTVRFFTLAIFSLLGVRRNSKKIAGRFCLSFYVDEDFLNLEPVQFSKKDIYLPFWIVTMKPIYGQKTYENFLEANFWIKTYFSRMPNVKVDRKFGILRYFGSFFEFILRGKFGAWIEKKFETIQQKRHVRHLHMLKNQASVIVKKHILKFHNIDKRKEIVRGFEAKLRKLC